MLIAHILHLDRLKGTVANRFGQHPAGVVGVDMHLDDALIVHKDHGIAQRLNGFFERLAGSVTDMLRRLGDNTLGAVGELDAGGVDFGEIGCAGMRLSGIRLRVGGSDVLPLERCQHTLEHGDESTAARVHDLCLLEHGEHFGGLLQHLLGGIDQPLEECLRVALIQLAFRLCRVGCSAHDGQDGALGGLSDRAVRLVCAGADCLCDILGVGFIQPLEGFCHSPEEQ